jgi:hypothetical protein
MSSDSQNTYDAVSHTVSPYLQLKLISIQNLSSIIDSYRIKPYLTLFSNGNLWESSIGSPSSDEIFAFEDVFEVEVDSSTCIFLSLYDKDDFGGDSLISRFALRYSDFHMWTESRSLSLAVDQMSDDESEAVPVTDSLLRGSLRAACVLTLELRFFSANYLGKVTAAIRNHKNIFKNKQAFTIYELVMTRNDGHSWRADLRYSEFLQMREDISKLIPGIEMIPFPGKTYFDWIGRLCFCASRFNEERIAERKIMLERFVNIVLDNLGEISCESVNNLLNIPNLL